MKLLFLTPQLPYPPQQGTTIRNFNLIKHLAPHHAVTLLSFGTTEELEQAEPLRVLCRRIETVPYPVRTIAQRAFATLFSPLPDMALRLRSPAMHALVAEVLRRETFDIVQVEAIEMARYVLDRQLARPHARLVFDDHNAEYMLQRTAFESDLHRIPRWHAALYSLIQWRKLARYERHVCSAADHILAASDADARYLERLFSPAPSPPCTIVPNGVDTGHFCPSTEVCAKPLADLALVYAGKMDFRPNVDAMLWFCEEILPRIRAEIPLAHISIVGQKPGPRILARRAQPGVEVTGWVPDTRPYVADAAVYVVPLRMGSGTRLKVLEAMAMGKAIVSTSLGVEGIDVEPGRHALLADTPEEFARTVVALLHDPDRRRALGLAARALAASTYDWRQIVPRLEQIYVGLGTSRQAEPAP